MKPYLLLLLVFVFNACTLSTIQERDITTYDPSVDISHIEFDGGNGTSLEEAVVILKARNASENLASEYAFLKNKFGEPNAEWKVLQLRNKETKKNKFDVVKIKDLETDSIHTFYFTIGSVNRDS